jgi:hypothetical protein
LGLLELIGHSTDKPEARSQRQRSSGLKPLNMRMQMSGDKRRKIKRSKEDLMF